jgi:hypothetical protein
MGTPTLPPIPTRAAAGAALLDRRLPGWHQDVDPDWLDMEDGRVDMLGQLYGWFEIGIAALTPGLGEAEVEAWVVAHGFDLDDSDLPPKGGSVDAYQVLTEAWRAELVRRRAGERQ